MLPRWSFLRTVIFFGQSLERHSEGRGLNTVFDAHFLIKKMQSQGTFTNSRNYFVSNATQLFDETVCLSLGHLYNFYASQTRSSISASPPEILFSLWIKSNFDKIHRKLAAHASKLKMKIYEMTLPVQIPVLNEVSHCVICEQFFSPDPKPVAELQVSLISIS